MWRAGQRIGDYELLSHLRDGGMASLFLARRLGPLGVTREVAIKLVHPEFAEDTQFREMFVDEARISLRIQHPNVVHVEALGEVKGTHYLVMEFVHGCSLSQLQRALLSKGRRLSPAFAARIAIHVAEGLHAAHETCDERGRPLEIVHRDVSPENILLAYAGHVKLIDFGIAKAYGRRHRTQDGLLKGKVRYMSPEQAHARPVDRRTDIYQLGIALWEMLTLRRLFDAENEVDLLAQVRAPQVPPPSALVDRIPPGLDAAVLSALAPDPARRPADARSFARALGRAVPGAYEVDGGALSALLFACMDAHRVEQRSTYPPRVFARLDGERIVDQSADRLGSTEPYGSDAHSPACRDTEPAYRGARSDPLREPEQNRPKSEPRRRRLVRLASELRNTLSELGTSISRLTLGIGKRPSAWFWLGALGAAALLAWLTLTLRRYPSVPPHSARAVPPHSAGATSPSAQAATGNAREKLTAGAGPLVLTPVSPTPPARASAAEKVAGPSVGSEPTPPRASAAEKVVGPSVGNEPTPPRASAAEKVAGPSVGSEPTPPRVSAAEKVAGPSVGSEPTPRSESAEPASADLPPSVRSGI